MPTISEVTFSRKYFLGNFETLELTLQAFLAEGEDPKQVFEKLEAEAQAYMQTHHAEALKSSNVLKPQAQPQPQAQQAPTQPGAQPKKRTAEEVKKAIPEDLLGLLRVEEGAEYIVLTPRQFLGSEIFSRVMECIEPLGGQYVSAGRGSHFRIKR